MIKNVLLDLDDTVLDFHKAEKIALMKALEVHGLNTDEEVLSSYSEINKIHWQRLERGEETRAEVLVNRFCDLFLKFGIESDPAQMKLTYESFLGQGHYFMPGAERMLKDLHGKYRLYLASNGTWKVQKGRIESAGISPLFDGLFVSELVGADKPSVDYFAAVFREIPDFKKSETVIVGDSLTSDILGGNRAGILTVWYNPKGAEKTDVAAPDYEIRDLSELAPLLQSL